MEKTPNDPLAKASGSVKVSAKKSENHFLSEAQPRSTRKLFLSFYAWYIYGCASFLQHGLTSEYQTSPAVPGTSCFSRNRRKNLSIGQQNYLF
jgi:hypothetical protein